MKFVAADMGDNLESNTELKKQAATNLAPTQMKLSWK